MERLGLKLGLALILGEDEPVVCQALLHEQAPNPNPNPNPNPKPKRKPVPKPEPRFAEHCCMNNANTPELEALVSTQCGAQETSPMPMNKRVLGACRASQYGAKWGLQFKNEDRWYFLMDWWFAAAPHVAAVRVNTVDMRMPCVHARACMRMHMCTLHTLVQSWIEISDTAHVHTAYLGAELDRDL